MLNAKELATKMHLQPSGEQRYGGAPYTKHLEDVVKNAEKYIKLIPHEYRVDVINAAWCHDLIEDTEMTPRKLASLFNDTVARIVTNVSNIRSLSKVEETLGTLMNIHGHRKSTYIKICDRMANGLNSKTGEDQKAKNMFKKYQKSYPTFRYALKVGNDLEIMWKDLDKVFDYTEPVVADDYINNLTSKLNKKMTGHDEDETEYIINEFLTEHTDYKKYIINKHKLHKDADIPKFIIYFAS